MKLRTPLLALVIAATGAFGLLSMDTAQAEIRTGSDSKSQQASVPGVGFLSALWDLARASYYSASYVDNPNWRIGMYGGAETDSLGYMVIGSADIGTGILNIFTGETGSIPIQHYTAPLDLDELVDANQTFAATSLYVLGGETKRFGYSVIMPESPSPLYGWVELDGSASTLGNLVVNATWAYDTTGAPITVGTVPEPTTLTLVGLGCLALLACYRLRTKQS
jgi:hypothetical protein